jgi:putative PIN family toxin of toxin-antitoxin system
MGRLVIDTNSLIQCISKRSRYHDIWLSLLDGRNNLCVSNEIIEEYEEILGRNVTPSFASLAVEVIINSPYTIFISPFYKFQAIIEDPDDDKFVDCAVAANARFLVTEDHHFNVLKNLDFPKVDLIGLDDFLEELHSDKLRS